MTARTVVPRAQGTPAPTDPVAPDTSAETQPELGKRAKVAADVPTTPSVTPVSATGRRGGSRWVLVAAATVLVLGLMIAFTQSRRGDDSVGAATTSLAPDDSGGGAEAAELGTIAKSGENTQAQTSKGEARHSARAALVALLDSSSPRIKRLAAQALARTGDNQMRSVLGSLLLTERSVINQVAIAHALAVLGDETGTSHLREALTSSRLDERYDAAVALASLGDDSGRQVLQQAMGVRNYQLGAAQVLASLQDKTAIELLKKTASAEGPDQPRYRAAVALGRIGDDSVRELLLQSIGEESHVAGAAEALATLGDKSAAAALTKQLDFNVDRLQAAKALVRLGVDVNLEPLVVALANSDESGVISAAEAILMLTDESRSGQAVRSAVE